MNVRSIVMALTLSPALLLTAACDTKERKPSMRRDSKTTEVQVTEWAKNVALKGEKGKTCFQLDLLAAALQEQKDKLISVRTIDLDFVVEGKTNGKEKKRRFNYTPEAGDLASQKANYFFAGKDRQALMSIVPSSELASTQAGELLNVFAHEKCADRVIFADKRIFQIEDQNEKFIRLTAINGTQEVREYFVNVRGQIQLTQIVAVNDVAACGAGTQKNHIVRRRLLIDLAEASDQGTQVSPGLTKLLSTYVYKTKEGLNLNSGLLTYMSAEIVSGRVQVACDAGKNTP